MTQTWEQQDSGAFLGLASARAIEFAGDDDDKLATVGFAAFLQERGIPAAWFLNHPLVVTTGLDAIGVRSDRGTDADTFTIPDSGEQWTLAARVLRGITPILLLVGLSSQHPQQLERFGPALPAHAFLRLSDWLMQFPHEWKGAT